MLMGGMLWELVQKQAEKRYLCAVVQEMPRLASGLSRDPKAAELLALLSQQGQRSVYIEGLAGSRDSYLLLASFRQEPTPMLLVCPDKEEASFAIDDLNALLGKPLVLSFPDSFRRPLVFSEPDYFQMQQRVEAVQNFNAGEPRLMVSYPEALFEKVVGAKCIAQAAIEIVLGGRTDLDDLVHKLCDSGFVRTDFVYEPGQFSIRGGIIDIFSFAGEYPYRVELDDVRVERIRSFDPQTQLSKQNIQRFSIIPNFEATGAGSRTSLMDAIPERTIVWVHDLPACIEGMNRSLEQALRHADKMVHYSDEQQVALLRDREFVMPEAFAESLERYRTVLFGALPGTGAHNTKLLMHCEPQPSFNKQFPLLIENLEALNARNYHCHLLTSGAAQVERFHNIFEDLQTNVRYFPEVITLREGFVDHDLKVACYTDHQIFSRQRGRTIRQGFTREQAMNLQALRELQPGDYVTHLDYGIGRFAGLEKIRMNGQMQESVRLIFRNDDILYVSIHSLHKISKYVGQEGTIPALSKLGSEQWKQLKLRTRQKVKDIARELIALYARRKAARGFAFNPDNYLQAELEASFMYEDTPDQYRATQEVKADMEKDCPMDRLICGDVGFGKTEVAIRAAFKAVQDGKQVAILVPTTILALQHYRTLRDRLREFPIDVDYLSRFRSAKEKTAMLKALADGKLDIIIGTISLLNAKVRFKDLGLLIVDEEQKFGVASKEKLRHLRHNVDTLTLTATPIPRTLQFSLMSARDLSVIQTPPPNRQPIHTERRVFSDELIRDAVMHEVSRGGQVFFVHNKVKSLPEVVSMLEKLCPGVDIAMAHGQMEAEKLEKVLIGFIDHQYDVLACTNIIETGLDIPNANTIIVNNAHQFGLSDLHQLRGRVGRSNRKAYCYLFAPPSSALTPEARKRLKTIEEFSDLGSGFHVAMRDLDIRGAGNLLGGEQSGFIADIGYEAYQRILEEAVSELKETEFSNVFASGEHLKKQIYVRETTIDTDVEMLIPDDYVANIQERLRLYQALDKIEDENGVAKFAEELRDRFGPVPPQVMELFDGLRLRWVGKALGFERIVLKKKKLQVYFVSNPASPYYETEGFRCLMAGLAKSGSGFTLKQTAHQLLASHEHVRGLAHAMEILRAFRPSEGETTPQEAAAGQQEDERQPIAT